MGWEQTEIDALATLQPDVLRRIVNDAVIPFYDHTLGPRIYAARSEWESAANAQIREQFDGDSMEALKSAAEERIEEMCDELDEIRSVLEESMKEVKVDVPKPAIPNSEIDESLQGTPLISTNWPWDDQTRALKTRKAYENGGAP